MTKGRDTPKDTPARSRRLEWPPWRTSRSVRGHQDRRLVLDASALGARPAEMVAVEVRQVVVVVFGKLDKATMPEAAPAASADTSLGSDDGGSQDVIAGVAELPIATAAGLFASGIGDAVGVLAVQARDSVAATSVREGDFLEALLGEPKASSLAGVYPGRLLYTGGGHRGPLPFDLEVPVCFGRRRGLVFVRAIRHYTTFGRQSKANIDFCGTIHVNCHSDVAGGRANAYDGGREDRREETPGRPAG
jgi:hypothetical protein